MPERNAAQFSACRGTTPTPAPAARAFASGFDLDRAALSDTSAVAAQALSSDGVRVEKVAAVQAALAAGEYLVPPAAVAAKVVDAMLARGWIGYAHLSADRGQDFEVPVLAVRNLPPPQFAPNRSSSDLASQRGPERLTFLRSPIDANFDISTGAPSID